MNSELKQVADELNIDAERNEAERSAEHAALAEAVAAPAAPVAAPQQTEMPFAMVDGEPYTEVPRDLYIPPDALQVFLEAFEGPLDLLLYLIRKQNLDILDIPIAEITRQYMGYIDVMQEMQLELAGEYLLMAAMLAEIKSRMLLPRAKSEEGQEEDDPRAELVRRLQEYERFKKAADDIDQLKRLDRDVIPASIEMVERRVVQVHPDVSMTELLKAFGDVVKRSSHFSHHQIQREPLSQRQRMTEILAMLENAEFVEFIRLFKPEEGRMGVTVTFISILELMKEGMLDIVQTEPYAPLHVRKASGRRNAPVENAGGDAENEAALSQPELPDENLIEEETDGLEELDAVTSAPVTEFVAEAQSDGAPDEIADANDVAGNHDAAIVDADVLTIDQLDTELPLAEEATVEVVIIDTAAGHTVSVADELVDVADDGVVLDAATLESVVPESVLTAGAADAQIEAVADVHGVHATDTDPAAAADEAVVTTEVVDVVATMTDEELELAELARQIAELEAEEAAAAARLAAGDSSSVIAEAALDPEEAELAELARQIAELEAEEAAERAAAAANAVPDPEKQTS